MSSRPRLSAITVAFLACAVGAAAASAAVPGAFRATDPETYLDLTGKSVCVYSQSDAPIEVTLTNEHNGAVAFQALIDRYKRCQAHGGLEPAYWRLCGQQPALGEFGSYSDCQQEKVFGKVDLDLGKARGERRPRFPLSAPAPLVGQRAKVVTQRYRRKCGYVPDPVAMDLVKLCDWVPGGKDKRKLTLERKQQIAAGKLEKPGKVTVRVSVAPFDYQGAPYKEVLASGSASRR